MAILAFDLKALDFPRANPNFHNKDFYVGELQFLTTDSIDIRSERVNAGRLAIHRFSNHADSSFRRTWSHIRNDKTSVAVFWFVQQGQITFSLPGGRYEIEAGQCALSQSSSPHYQVTRRDQSGCYRAMAVVVPTHFLHGKFNEAADIGKAFDVDPRHIAFSTQILSSVFEHGDDIDDDEAEHIVLAVVSNILKAADHGSAGPRRVSIAERRIDEVIRCIDQNFSNTDLNGEFVARACGISVRYLCHLLSDHDLSFSHLLWERRIKTAHEWLLKKEMAGYSLSEIAYFAGFKSSAHFSRVFKKRYGVSPSQLRQTALIAAETDPSDGETREGFH